MAAVSDGWAFAAGPEYTVGVEEELMLLDADTLHLVSSGDAVVTRARDEIHVKREFRQCMVEIASRPWASSGELLADLVGLRASVVRAAAAQGCLVAGSGTHPFSVAEDQPTTATARYQSIMEEVGFPWRRAVVFGTHVHVALACADKAIQVTEALLPDLPVLIALGAASPFWRGRETGLASTRLAVLAGVPRTGLPPALASFADYAATLGVLRRAGAVPDASQVWWDVRSQARLGTLEVRVFDGQPRVHDSAAFAGLVQSLVRFHGRQWDAGRRASADRFVVAENRWLAMRHGLAARLVTPDGRGRPARELLARLLDRLAADADAVGAGWALEHLARLADQGGPVAAMRRRHEETGDLAAVARWLAGLSSDLPLGCPARGAGVTARPAGP